MLTPRRCSCCPFQKPEQDEAWLEAQAALSLPQRTTGGLAMALAAANAACPSWEICAPFTLRSIGGCWRVTAKFTLIYTYRVSRPRFGSLT